MDAGKREDCAFEKLITRNVPHILEKIFFSLDYRSFQSCFRVNSTWNELLSSPSYKKMSAKKLNEKEENEKKLWRASCTGNLGEVKRLISSGLWMDVNCVQFTFNRTPLFVAASEGHKHIVQILLDAGAEPDKADEVLWTPLLWCCATYGREDIVQLLLERGADPNKASTREYTPLYRAVRYGCKETVQLLLEHGADPNKASPLGDPPLHFGAREGKIEIVQLLLERGADHKKKDAWRMTPLDYATKKGHKEVAQLLSQYTTRGKN